MKLPKTIKELGYRHRRKVGFKYTDLPELYENLKRTRKMWLDYQRWNTKYCQHLNGDLGIDFVHLDLLEKLKNSFHHHWLVFYGEDAEKELKVMHNRSIFEAEDWRTALIMIDYDPPRIDTYRKTTVFVDDTAVHFESEDVLQDYNDALKYAQNCLVDEIVRADASEMFVIHAKGRYWFNLREHLVRVERE